MSLFRGQITKATVVTSTSIRRHADGFTSATQVLFSGISRQLDRATGHGDIELLKRKVEEQGMPSTDCIADVAHKFTVAILF